MERLDKFVEAVAFTSERGVVDSVLPLAAAVAYFGIRSAFRKIKTARSVPSEPEGEMFNSAACHPDVQADLNLKSENQEL
jgi:hypothetical protein